MTTPSINANNHPASDMVNTVVARAHIRKMRGGAQSHLIEGADGFFYVVKFRNNPQHRRVLVNEFISSCLLRKLNIATPDIALIEVRPSLIESSPQLCIELASHTMPVEAGLHFGSKCPVDPNTVAIYDFLPDALLDKVNNCADFRGVMIFDKWVSNMDPRQTIFCRTAHRTSLNIAGSCSRPYRAFMIDNGFAFDGSRWQFINSTVQGLYSRRQVYLCVSGLASFQPWLDRIIRFPEPLLQKIFEAIPTQWLDGDGADLTRLFRALTLRRNMVATLVEACAQAPLSPFPNWCH
jgi:hypothetical protein